MLTLHNLYTFQESLDQWSTAPFELLCDDQFAVFPNAVLCFFTVGSEAPSAQLDSPSDLTWKPGRLDYDPQDQWPWLPGKVREVFDLKTRVRLRSHQLLLRANPNAPFVYAGEAHLASYGSSATIGRENATFILREKLPRETWLQMGGYSGWRIEVNHTVHFVEAADEALLAALLAQLPQQQFSHLIMTRYEQDSLHVYTNGRRGWMMYLRYPQDAGICLQNRETGEDPAAEEHFHCVCGISLAFPIEQTVDQGFALRAAQDFFATGQLPNTLHWQTGD